MDIKKANREIPKIDRGNIINLRFYKHIKTGGVYIVNGFGIREDTLKTMVIYTQGHTGTIFIRPIKEFEEKFQLIEKKKK